MNDAFFIAAQTGIVPLAEGPPGVGKTKVIEAFARSLGRHFEPVFGNQCDPCDIMGIPHPVGEDRPRVEFLKADWRYRAETAEGGSVVLFDELTTCPPSVQAAMLKVIQDGLPNTLILAAANPPHQAANGVELAPPMINRLYLHEWSMTPQMWVLAAMSGFPDPQFPVLPGGWEVGVPGCLSKVSAFITKMPGLGTAYPKHASKASRPWPSYRSWTNAARLMAAADSVHARKEVRAELVRGCVGEGAAMEFVNWESKLDLQDPEELLSNPTCTKLYDRGDIMFAQMSSMLSCVVGNNTPDRWTRAWAVLAVVQKKHADVAMHSGALLFHNRPKGETEISLPMPKSATTWVLPMLQTLQRGASGK